MVQPSSLRFMSESALALSQAPQDTTLAAHETRLDDLEVLGGISPGSTSDATVHALLINPDSDSAKAIYSGIPVSAGNAPYSADPTGVVDATAALNAASAAATAKGPNARLFIPAGNYKISGTVKFACGLDASQATLTYNGTGAAVIVGNDATPGAVTYRLKQHLPRVVCGNSGNWDGSSVGVTLLNLNACDVYVPWVQDFETNLLCIGRGTGFAYNTVTLGAIGQGHHNVILTQDETGWCNQNVFIGGRINKAAGKGAVLGDTTGGMLELLHGSTSISGPNNNTFIGTSIEGQNWDYYRADLDGAKFNTFLNCRWEVVTDPNSRVRYRNGSTDNRIIGGYDSWKITEEFDATSPGGTILDGQGAYVSAIIPTTNPQSIPNNVWTTINTWSSMSSRRITYDAATGAFKPRAGRWLITASIVYTPNATGRRRASILTSGGQTIDMGETPGNAQRSTIRLGRPYKFDGNETFVIQTDQNSGAALTLESTAGYVRMSAELLGV